MSDELKSLFAMPKKIREPLVEAQKKAKTLLANAEMLKSLGVISVKDETDLKSLLDIASRIEKITSEAPEEIEEAK